MATTPQFSYIHNRSLVKDALTDESHGIDWDSLELNLNGCESWIDASDDGRDEES